MKYYRAVVRNRFLTIAKSGLFNDKSRIPNSHEWLTLLHSHLLAKFCLFFYSAFAKTKKIGGRDQADKEFQSLARRTVFDFRGESMKLIEKVNAKAVYLVRDHNPPNSSPKSSTSRYIFQPFIASQIEEDALKRVGIVSAYLHSSENPDIEPLENLKRVHEDYLTKLKDKLDRAKVEKDKTKDFDARKNKGPAPNSLIQQ